LNGIAPVGPSATSVAGAPRGRCCRRRAPVALTSSERAPPATRDRKPQRARARGREARSSSDGSDVTLRAPCDRHRGLGAAGSVQRDDLSHREAWSAPEPVALLLSTSRTEGIARGPRGPAMERRVAPTPRFASRCASVDSRRNALRIPVKRSDALATVMRRRRPDFRTVYERACADGTPPRGGCQAARTATPSVDQPVVARPAVGVDHAREGHPPTKHPLQYGLRAVRHDLLVHLPVASPKADHCGRTRRAPVCRTPAAGRSTPRRPRPRRASATAPAPRPLPGAGERVGC
jgi:hypothetical protein